MRRGRETVFDIAILIAACLLLTYPVLKYGAPDIAFDGFRHTGWGRDVATQFLHGDWYPRWFSGANGGLGGPTGFFYPPLAHYAVTIFWPLFAAHDPQGWFAVGYSLALGQILSAITAYLWLRSVATPRSALLGGLVYAIAPYHLAIDLYQRCAAAEFWVFVWFPLLLLSAQALIRHSRWALPLAAISYALAVSSHPTVSLFFGLVVVLYVFFFSDGEQISRRIRDTVLMGVALAAGVALNGQYLLPAIFDQSKAYIEWQTTLYNYRDGWLIQHGQDLRELIHSLHVLLVGSQPRDHVAAEIWGKASIVIVTGSALLAVLALLALIFRCEKVKTNRRMALFYACFAIASVLLMNRVSSAVWELVPILKFLQFPFRLNIMLVIAVAALTALAAPYLWQARVRLITLLLIVIVGGWVAIDIHEPRLMYSSLRYAQNWTRVKQVFFRLQLDEPSMWPKPANVSALSSVSSFEQFLTAHPPKSAELVPAGAGTARVLRWEPRRVLLEIRAPQDSSLILNHFYYSGWRGRIEGTAKDFPIEASSDGLIEIKVPKGTYQLVVELPKDTAEQAGMIVSWLALLLLAGSFVYVWRTGTGASDSVRTGSVREET